MALTNPPVVTSAVDALRAFVRRQPVAFPHTVAEQLAQWGFSISPLTDNGISPIDVRRATLAADILSGVGRDFTLNAPDPIQTQDDDQPAVSVPDLTVLITGPLSGQSGDGTLVVIARLNVDGTPAYSNPDGVLLPRRYLPTNGLTGMRGFGQADLGPEPSRGVVIATVPLSTASMQDLGVAVTAGQVVAFSGTVAGQVLAKVPFIGGVVSAAYSGAEMAERPTGSNIVQFIVDVATGGGGIAGQIARIAVPGLGTLQAIADFAAGDARSIMQGIATVLTAPVAILYGPLGAAAQGAARWLAGKVYDWFHEREVNAAFDQASAQRQAADMRRAEQLSYLSPDEYGRYLAEQEQAALAQDIQNYAAELAAYQGAEPTVADVAEGLGIAPDVVTTALTPPVVVADVDIYESYDQMCPIVDPTVGHSTCNWGPWDACGVCASARIAAAERMAETTAAAEPVPEASAPALPPAPEAA